MCNIHSMYESVCHIECYHFEGISREFSTEEVSVIPTAVETMVPPERGESLYIASLETIKVIIYLIFLQSFASICRSKGIPRRC